MAEATPVTVFIRAGEPSCDEVRRHLDQRGIGYTVRDVTTDPSASAILFGRLGRIAVPTVQVGERLVVGYDPVQLARFLPSPKDEQPPMAFGAAIRSVSAEVARERGLRVAFGVEVGKVTPGSPAEECGLQPGDIITAIGPYTVDGGAEQFRRAVAARRAGDAMSLTVWREGKALQLTASFPQTAAEAPTQ